MQRVSVIILTKNEELLIARAIKSATACADEILVIDSNSTDRTREIAEAAGAIVHSQDWLGWVGQRQRAAELARHDWLFFLEADEIVTPELSDDIIRVMADDPSPRTGFALERVDEFLGRTTFNMKRKSKRVNFIRVYNKTESEWRSDMLIHEEVRCIGLIVRLNGALLHWRNYMLSEQIATYNRYSDLEARELNDLGTTKLTLRLFFKPVLRFLWVYLKCGHWRLGAHGFIWSGMNAFAEFLRLAKAWETRHAPRVIDPPSSVYRQSSDKSDEKSAACINRHGDRPNHD